MAIGRRSSTLSFFFFNDTATTEIYTLSLHDALPIWIVHVHARDARPLALVAGQRGNAAGRIERAAKRHVHALRRSEEHTSELQSHLNLVCRLLLENKKGSDAYPHDQDHSVARLLARV